MVHLPNMSSLTVHGPLLPIGGKSSKPPFKKQKTVRQESSSEEDEPTISVFKRPKPNDSADKRPQRVDSSPSSEDEDLPIRKRKDPKQAPPPKAALASSEEEAPAESDEEEDRPLTGRKQKAEQSPTTERADPKKPKPLPKAEQVVNDAFAKAMEKRVPKPSPDDVDDGFDHWSPETEEQKHVLCCNGAKNDT